MITHETPYIITAISFVSISYNLTCRRYIERKQKRARCDRKEAEFKMHFNDCRTWRGEKTPLNVIANDHPEKK